MDYINNNAHKKEFILNPVKRNNIIGDIEYNYIEPIDFLKIVIPNEMNVVVKRISQEGVIKMHFSCYTNKSIDSCFYTFKWGINKASLYLKMIKNYKEFEKEVLKCTILIPNNIGDLKIIKTQPKWTK